MQAIKNVSKVENSIAKKRLKNSLMYEASICWIEYRRLIEISCQVAERHVTELDDLSITEMRQLKNKIKKEGWRLRT